MQDSVSIIINIIKEENISFYDTDTILLFNHTMTQLGLTAFRTGVMMYAHTCLDD